ncbi:hypothetical protein EDD15DRAFT_2177642 [Pisolithus albus]|nr:hypothetical protein EDD15DRAFT_2177642 [Pisolithus albus]
MDVQGGARELHETEGRLDEQKQVMAYLNRFSKDVKAQWSNIELHNIGHIYYSPS